MNTQNFKQVIAISVAAVLASACDQLPFDMPGSSAPTAPSTTDQATTATPEATSDATLEATATPQDATVEEVAAPLDPNRVCKAYEDGFQNITTPSIRDIEGCWLQRRRTDVDGYLKYENGVLHGLGSGFLSSGDFPYAYYDRCMSQVPSPEGRVVRTLWICHIVLKATDRSMDIEFRNVQTGNQPDYRQYTLVTREDAVRLDAQLAARLNSGAQ